jgi:hypothetical protein
MATHCICCGKKGVRWPKLHPTVCSMRCPAEYWLLHCEQPNHCGECGECVRFYGECPDHPDDDEEGGA